ncbi:hypothetical protein GGS24DRAFT_353486 [Hypoxylon argillaceum]|nr:hypothetical protein GGS24DRAFT_353486 [Hypoxylon argillaceum]KAI1153592.1 hypothetical protein F4825DRAFT_414341 [Nemania diffusa]
MSSTASSNSPSEQTTFKHQLDKAANEARQPTSNQDNSNTSSLIEKVTEYVPVASKLLGTDQSRQKQASPEDLPGPPNRPEHDNRIAEFVREQHRSKKHDSELGS